MSKLVFREVEGDLFTAPDEYALAHCVAADMKMGAGIAVKFREKYGQIDDLLNQGATAGGLAILKDGSRFIYYLVSKNKTYQKPTYQDLFLSLHAMKAHMVRNQDKKKHLIIDSSVHTNHLNLKTFFRKRMALQNWPFHKLAAVWMDFNGTRLRIN